MLELINFNINTRPQARPAQLYSKTDNIVMFKKSSPNSMHTIPLATIVKNSVFLQKCTLCTPTLFLSATTYLYKPQCQVQLLMHKIPGCVVHPQN